MSGIANGDPERRPMVFGIGLIKTGTSSLRDALEVLGYKTGGG